MGKEEKILNADEFYKLAKELIRNEKYIDTCDSYIFNGYRLVIYNNGKTEAERQSDLRKRRITKGICVVCGEEVKEVKKDGNKYRKCILCRKVESENRKAKYYNGNYIPKSRDQIKKELFPENDWVKKLKEDVKEFQKKKVEKRKIIRKVIKKNIFQKY